MSLVSFGKLHFERFFKTFFLFLFHFFVFIALFSLSIFHLQRFKFFENALALTEISGEMEKVGGYVGVRGSVAYVPQQPWIQNLSLKDNITFGKKFDQRFYDRVIRACALTQDIAILPQGDATEIGEKVSLDEKLGCFFCSVTFIFRYASACCPQCFFRTQADSDVGILQ